MSSRMVTVAGIELEVAEDGAGTPLLMLHGAGGFDPRHPVNALLAARRRLICPSHPGTGSISCGTRSGSAIR